MNHATGLTTKSMQKRLVLHYDMTVEYYFVQNMCEKSTFGSRLDEFGKGC
jgi:hypothetical protein